MGTISVSVPDDLQKRMAAQDEINWSAIARKAFEEKLDELHFLKQLARKSKLTLKDAEQLSEKIRNNVANKFRNLSL